MVSAKMEEGLELRMVVTDGGRLVVVSRDGLVLRIVIGPEWSFWAAVMEARVAGAREVELGGVGSAMMRVDADRDEYEAAAVALRILERKDWQN